MLLVNNYTKTNIMKKSITFLFTAICLFLFNTSNAQTTGSDPVYLETISNASNTINFIAGVYPKTYVYSEANQNSKLTLRIKNNAKVEYQWKDYKVYILLKDNVLFYNYSTKAETGEFACTYKIEGNEGFHEQTICFSKKFEIADIKEMWISFGDDTFIHLLYVPGK